MRQQIRGGGYSTHTDKAGETCRPNPVVVQESREAFVAAFFFVERNDMTGFVLTGGFASERSEMAKRLAVCVGWTENPLTLN